MMSATRLFLKTILPTRRRAQAKRIYHALDYWFTSLMARWSFSSKLYYGLFNRAFDREFHGVLAGKRRYLDDVRRGLDHQYLLRRNTHRIEKGLLMRPRRDVFATSYIEETVEHFGEALRATDATAAESELQWTQDVLETYFTSTGTHPTIDRAKRLYHDVRSQRTVGGERQTPLAPYHRDLDAPPPVGFEQLHALAQRRRSVRWYLPKPVPRTLIDRALEVAAQAPSACNRQPFEFRIFDDPNDVADVVTMPGGTAGFHHNVPVIVVVVGKLNAYFSERDRHLVYIDGSLAAMSFMLALETLGLSSCPINWPDVAGRERRIRKRLQLQPYERPIMMISLGYPDPEGMVARSEKKPLSQIRSFNR